MQISHFFRFKRVIPNVWTTLLHFHLSWPDHDCCNPMGVGLILFNEQIIHQETEPHAIVTVALDPSTTVSHKPSTPQQQQQQQQQITTTHTFTKDYHLRTKMDSWHKSKESRFKLTWTFSRSPSQALSHWLHRLWSQEAGRKCLGHISIYKFTFEK